MGTANIKGVLIGLVLLVVGAGFAASAATDPFIQNSTLLTLIVGFVPVGLGIAVLIRAFKAL